MNKLLFHEGGQPFNLDELEFLQSSLSEGIKGLTALLPDGFYGTVTSPKDATKEPYKWSGGLLIIQGRAAWLKEGSLMNPTGAALYAKITEQETHPRDFEDGSAHPTRLEQEGRVVTEVAQGELYIPISPTNQSQLLVGGRMRSSFITYPGTDEVFIGYITSLELQHLNLYIVSGTVQAFANDRSLKDGRIGDYAYFGDLVSETYLSGGGIVSIPGLSTASQISLHEGRIYLTDLKGMPISKIPENTTIRFSFLKTTLPWQATI